MKQTHFAQFQLKELVALLLICAICRVGAEFEGCDTVMSLNPGLSYLESPQYPKYYPARTACRYNFIAPLDYVIVVKCEINLPQGNDCYPDRFYLSADGESSVTNSEYYCGQNTVEGTSRFRRLTLAYTSNGGRGQFQCQLRAVKQSCDCGWSISSRIVNGKNASLNEFPSMVGLFDKTQQTVFCGGSIISHRYILTAAHCNQLQSNVTNIAAFVGGTNLYPEIKTPYSAYYDIVQFIKHPNYSANPLMNDIAILVTAEIIEWSRAVGPICLPPISASANTFTNYDVDVIGWGTIIFGGRTSDVLKKVTLRVMSNSLCKRSYKDLTEDELCTYDPTGRGQDSCQYDSGGPVILRATRQYLLGTVAYGMLCGSAAPGVNTRITSHLIWILMTTEFSTCNK